MTEPERKTQIAAKKQRGVYFILHFIVLLCAVVFLALCAFAWFDNKTPDLSLGGMLIMWVAFNVTFTIALICSIALEALFRSERTRWAWIFLSSFALPYLISIVL